MEMPRQSKLSKRGYIRILFRDDLRQASAYFDNCHVSSNSDQSQFFPAALSVEIAQIHAYWEDSLYAVTSFPKAEEKNWRVLVMVEQIVEDRKLLGAGNDADKRALVEVKKLFKHHFMIYANRLPFCNVV